MRPSSSTSGLPGPGTILGGRYRLEGTLGRGAMGEVFCALDQVSGRRVAVKVLLGRLDPNRLVRFQREGVAAANLRHPGILRVHSAGEDGGRPYLVCELVPEARGLGEVLPDLPLIRRVELVRDAARAIGFAHQQGVVHRDVKPDNLLVSGEGRLLVADFGLAAVQGEDRLTQAGTLLGTPHYLAPETFAGTWGPGADVWALGVVLYEALAGQRPFEGDSLTELAARITEARPTPIRRLRPEVPKPLELVCSRALLPEPDLRYADGDALADDLDLVLAGSSPSASAMRAAWGGLSLRRVGLTASLVVAVLSVAVAAAWALREPSISTRGGQARPPRAGAVASGPAQQERKALAGIDDRVKRYWEGLAWLERHPTAEGRADVRLTLEAAARAGPLARLRAGRSWTATHVLPDGRLVTSGIRGGGGIRLWSSEGPGRTYEEVGAWTTRDRILVAPWPGGSTPTFLVVEEGFGLGQLGFDKQGPSPLLMPVLPAGPLKACFLAGPTESPWFVVSAGDINVCWSIDHPTGPILPDHEEHLAVYTAAGRAGVDRLVVSFKVEPEASLVRVWELSTETVLSSHPLPQKTRVMDLSPAGLRVAVGTAHGVLYLLDVGAESGAAPRIFEDESAGGGWGGFAHNGSVDQLAFTADGRHVVSISHDTENGDELKVWGVASGELLSELPLISRVVGFCFDVRPGYAWLGTADGEAQLWALPVPLTPRWD